MDDSTESKCNDHDTTDSDESRATDDSIAATTSQAVDPIDAGGCEEHVKSSDCNVPKNVIQINDLTFTDSARRETQKIIEQYFYRLTVGCGDNNCTNMDCASNYEVEPLAPNEAAARAIFLLTVNAKLCSVDVELSHR